MFAPNLILYVVSASEEHHTGSSQINPCYVKELLGAMIELRALSLRRFRKVTPACLRKGTQCTPHIRVDRDSHPGGTGRFATASSIKTLISSAGTSFAPYDAARWSRRSARSYPRTIR